MAYLLFVSGTILFSECAVATGQWSPSIRQALSLSPRYICTINKGEGLKPSLCFDFIIYILFTLCSPHLQPFSAGVAGSLWIKDDSTQINLGESSTMSFFVVHKLKIICMISDTELVNPLLMSFLLLPREEFSNVIWVSLLVKLICWANEKPTLLNIKLSWLELGTTWLNKSN